ncbi:MAG: GDP-mannose 4,6-dehydratase, partial [Candidatus Omnitrophica bacterium]|nr:GDP-mannose 4,6-dehydratase [Candidatus Omnitrophota bacterium]
MKIVEKFWKGKKVLVTGANGFLASHISVKLLKSGASVIGIIKENIPASFLDLERKKNQFKKLKILKGDIADYAFIKRLFKNYKPDICFHVAAQAIVGKANKSPIPTLKTNIEGTWNILDVAREFSPQTKIVVASSDKAYGEHKKLPYTESAALQALHPYDASKACTDILSRTYAHTYGLGVAVTRCANIYGPGDLNFSRIVPDTLRSAISGKDPVIRSDGTPLRDYVFVCDIVNAYLLLAKALFQGKPGVRGEAFNFGSGEPISVLKLVNVIINASGKRNLKPQILSRTKIKGEIDKQYLSSRKAGNVLHWAPKYKL